jgi:DNA-binding transcriptional LysR family regulator
MKKKACTEIQEFLGVKKGEIYVGGSTIPGEYILPNLIRRFREDYPLISIMLTIADSSKIKKDVLEGTLELGVVGAITSDKNLTYHNLWEDELVLAVPALHRWAEKEEVLVQDLIDEPFILRESGSGTLKVMADYLGLSVSRLTESFQVVARLGSSTAVKEAIKAGLGISILSSRAIGTELKAGLIKALRLKGITMKRHFYLIKDKRRTASPLCRAMFDFLRSNSKQRGGHN